jgi:glycosyltransferase involved in cell wall biosynthesis
MRTAYWWSRRAILNVPVESVSWLPRVSAKAVCIPVGPNVPAIRRRRGNDETTMRSAKRTVVVFCVTGGASGRREVADVTWAVWRATETVGRLRLVVLGRGAREAEEALRESVDGAKIDLSVLGLLPAADVSHALAEADVMLFVRAPFSSQRGSGIAGIACGLPVVGYAGPQTGAPATEAGVILVPQGDREALARALAEVLSDDNLWWRLHQRSTEAYDRYFSWDAISARFIEALGL